jgi:hypothetical protein
LSPISPAQQFLSFTTSTNSLWPTAALPLQDPAVQAAVAELKAAKEAVGHLELLIAAYTAPVAISSRAQTPSLQQARQHGYGVLAALQQSQMLEQAAQQKPV